MNGRAHIFVFLILTVAGLFSGPATATPQAAPASTQHRVFLPLVRAGGTTPLQQRPSLELIDAALQAGEISEGDALHYQAQAVAGDPALPARFQSAEVGEGAFLVFERITRSLPKLSPAAQSRLRPYLLPPTAADSWYTKNVMAAGVATSSPGLAATTLTWQTFDTTNGKVKLWYHPELEGAEARARQVGAAIDGAIWPKLTDLFGRQIRPDCGSTCEGGGRDNRIDVYLVRGTYQSVGSITLPDGASAYLIVPMTTSFDEIVEHLAFAFMTAFPMYSEQLSEYWWLKLALPSYAIQHVYPTSNQDPLYPRTNPEHRKAKLFLNKPELPLEDEGRYWDGQAGSYLFFYNYPPSLIPLVMERAANPNSLAALNDALSEGPGEPLTESWRHFAAANWNDDMFTHYRDSDQLTHKAGVRDIHFLTGPGVERFPVSLKHLSASYHSFTFAEEIRRVTFTNPVALEGPEGGHVWALLLMADGSVRLEDWEDVTTRVFCRDNPDENVDTVYLIVSNGQWQDRSKVMQTADGTVKTELNCGACARTAATTRWKARLTVSYDESDSGDGPGYPVSARARRSGTYEAILEASAGSEGMAEWDADSAQGTVSIDDLYVEPSDSFPTQATGAPTVSQTGMSLNREACTFSLTSVATLSVGGKGVSDMVTVFHLFMHRLTVQEPADPNAPLVLRGTTSLPWPTGGFNPESSNVVQLGVTPGSGGVLGIRSERGATDAGFARVTWELTALAP